ncbi:hypothetical protein JTE90_009284 [Oedothorax gibbosus]|uniref:Uncharacterized protein n=1 Tax=Oedothorax gibbosus TaxID=931172 RepID=A0AAV6V283_9ARAC|nr:hypothetical protein JTE90_009284 [Oedothorax gibbosus]
MAVFFSIEVDSTQDIAVMDQLALCVRFVFDGEVKAKAERSQASTELKPLYMDLQATTPVHIPRHQLTVAFIFRDFTLFGTTILSDLTEAARKSLKTENSLTRQEFNRINTRLLRPPGNTTHNTDVRGLYKLDNNVFIVNKWFTFGLFTVEAGEKHIYRSNSAILLCLMPDVKTQVDRKTPTLNRRSFCPEDYTYFEMSVF